MQGWKRNLMTVVGWFFLLRVNQTEFMSVKLLLRHKLRTYQLLFWSTVKKQNRETRFKFKHFSSTFWVPNLIEIVDCYFKWNSVKLTKFLHCTCPQRHFWTRGPLTATPPLTGCTWLDNMAAGLGTLSQNFAKTVHWNAFQQDVFRWGIQLATQLLNHHPFCGIPEAASCTRGTLICMK